MDAALPSRRTIYSSTILNHQVVSDIASLRNAKSAWIPPLDTNHCEFLNPRVASLLAHPFTDHAKSGISDAASTHISQDMNYGKLSAATPIITQTRYQINEPDTIPSLPIPYIDSDDSDDSKVKVTNSLRFRSKVINYRHATNHAPFAEEMQSEDLYPEQAAGHSLSLGCDHSFA